MNCNEIRNWMSPYLDSELGQTKTFEVSEHLRRCPTCAKRFDAEREVDSAMRSQLVTQTMPQSMPEELWTGFQRELTMPSWVRRLNSWQGLAVAACLAIAVISSFVILNPGDKQLSMPVIANRFITETPNNQPFPVKQTESELVDEILRQDYGLHFASTSEVESMGHRDFQLVSATRRTDDTGLAYLDVRLNCCGQPVLVTIARQTDGLLPAPFSGITSRNTAESQIQSKDVKLAHTTMGGVHVMVVSRHSVKHIIDSISLATT